MHVKGSVSQCTQGLVLLSCSGYSTLMSYATKITSSSKLKSMFFLTCFSFATGGLWELFIKCDNKLLKEGWETAIKSKQEKCILLFL